MADNAQPPAPAKSSGSASPFNRPAPRAIRAWFDTLRSGIVEFERDWDRTRPPRIKLTVGAPPVINFRPAPVMAAGRDLGYFLKEPGIAAFVLPLDTSSGVDPEKDHVYLAGEFNGWKAAGEAAWRLEPATVGGERVLLWTGPTEEVLRPEGQRFKFVTGDGIWLPIPENAPNEMRDGGVVNRLAVSARTGNHLWRFLLADSGDLSAAWSVSAGSAPGEPDIPLIPGRFFYQLASDLPLGASIDDTSTTFRIFAPRARAVTLKICHDLAARPEALTFELARRTDGDGAAGIWEVEVDQALHGWYYWYFINGVKDGPGRFDSNIPVLDPYALAAVDRTGPGIVIDRRRMGRVDEPFTTPSWQDLVIAEAHVRDLAAQAPIVATAEERLGFTGLKKWVEHPDFHLHHLGVNCVELQPVQEFDNRTREEYHWGYMTANYFAPASAYSLAPAMASGIRELQDLVAAFHRRGIAVLLDVVYNHVGEPAHLMLADRLYYFEQDAAGQLANWSGCGNDLRAGAAMSKRLIIDSLIHLIEVFGVDGFRFDLAELLGFDVLRSIEAALKRVKPDVILIAEPWSFRGHIAGALRDTGWASWNDGYRNAVREYVLGRLSGRDMEYSLRGSPWYFAKWPAQTVNYSESHDDRAFLDMITENGGNDGFHPTPHDVQRVHLAAALMFVSIGIPMVSAGQDFLRSKHGVNNTYQRGDLNALDYKRLVRHLPTHAYFSDWIAFRLSDAGALLRQFSRPSEAFFRFFRREEGAAPLAMMLNADLSQGRKRLLFAVNPTLEDAYVPLGDAGSEGRSWVQVADEVRFLARASRAATRPVEPEVVLPPLSCVLWQSPGDSALRS